MQRLSANKAFESRSASNGICARLALIPAGQVHLRQPRVGCDRGEDNNFGVCNIKAKQSRPVIDDSPPNKGSSRAVRLLLTASHDT